MALFEQRLTDTLGDAAMRLAMQDQRIDRPADIVDRGVADDFDLAGIGIDLHLANLGAVREARNRDDLVGNRRERSLQVRRQVGAPGRGRGNVENADLTVGASDPETAMRELDIDLAGFEEEARRSCAPWR